MKNLFSYVRIAALAAATFAAGSFLTPSDASAQGRHGWGGHQGRHHYAPRAHRHHFAPRHFGYRHYAPRRIYRPVRYAAPYYIAPRCVVRKHWVATQWGPRKIHRRVCY